MSWLRGWPHSATVAVSTSQGEPPEFRRSGDRRLATHSGSSHSTIPSQLTAVGRSPFQKLEAFGVRFDAAITGHCLLCGGRFNPQHTMRLSRSTVCQESKKEVVLQSSRHCTAVSVSLRAVHACLSSPGTDPRDARLIWFFCDIFFRNFTALGLVPLLIRVSKFLTRIAPKSRRSRVV